MTPVPHRTVVCKSYGVRTPSQSRVNRDQLERVPGTESKIRDRSPVKDRMVHRTTVADFRLHAAFGVQLVPEIATFFGSRSRPRLEPAIGCDRMMSTSVVASNELS